jgi:hypothetical protein
LKKFDYLSKRTGRNTGVSPWFAMMGPVGDDQKLLHCKIFIALHYLRDIYAVELAGTARPPSEQVVRAPGIAHGGALRRL